MMSGLKGWLLKPASLYWIEKRWKATGLGQDFGVGEDVSAQLELLICSVFMCVCCWSVVLDTHENTTKTAYGLAIGIGLLETLNWMRILRPQKIVYLNLYRKISISFDIWWLKNFPVCALFKIRNKNVRSWLYKNICEALSVLRSFYSSCLPFILESWWSWFLCSESVTAAVFSLQQRENIAEGHLVQDIAARTAFWLSLSPPSYSHNCCVYIFIFLIPFLVGYFLSECFTNIWYLFYSVTWMFCLKQVLLGL